MSRRAEKPHAAAADVKTILSQPTRKLTEAERKQRIDFYADNPNVHAEAVEPSTFARNPRGN